jgi:hypothetical protein
LLPAPVSVFHAPGTLARQDPATGGGQIACLKKLTCASSSTYGWP